MVPLIDLSRRMSRSVGAFSESMESVLRSGVVLLGPRTEEFEVAFSSFIGARGAVAVSSGASALQLALAALGVGPGDEVVVPALTAVPTASAVLAVGATPRFADVDDSTATLSVDSVRSLIGPRTKACIAVHLYGRPVEELRSLVELGIPLIEDCAQSHGATEQVVGTVACYSFYPTKNLGGIGDGGLVASDDSELIARIKRLRAHGQVEQYVHTEISQNHRMSEIEAAWLSHQLPGLPDGNKRRHGILDEYRRAAPALQWQADHPSHVAHLAVVRVDDRGRFREWMSSRGVATGVHYPLALTEQPAYREFTTLACPNAERWSAGCVSVPCFPELEDREIDIVCEALAKFAP